MKRQKNQDDAEFAKRNNIVVEVKMATFTRTNSIIPFEHYGEQSPVLACDDVEMTFTFAFAKSIDAIHALFSTGDIPIDDDILSDWQNLDKYLDIPILFQISNNKTWQDKGDENLWLFKLQGYKQSEEYNTTWAAKNGHLEILKWIRANGGEWTERAADYTAESGHLETLKWIRANGGTWTSWATNSAARNGHLETLKWIRDNGGTWTSNAANWAATSGHLETLKWIRANGGTWTSDATNWAARNGHLETLKWIRANGGKWTSAAADWAAENGHLETLKWIRANGGKWTPSAADMAARNGHLETLK